MQILVITIILVIKLGKEYINSCFNFFYLYFKITCSITLSLNGIKAGFYCIKLEPVFHNLPSLLIEAESFN